MESSTAPLEMHLTPSPTTPWYDAANGSSYNSTFASPPTYLTTWVTLANVVVFSVGVFGNTLVIVVLARVKEMKTSTNFCLMNLSIADLLVLLICQPAAMLEFYEQEKWVLGDFMCKLVVFLENLVTNASILIILLVSCGRYNAVCRPLEAYSRGNKSRTLIAMAMLWIFVISVTSPLLQMAHTTEEFHLVDHTMVSICITPIKYTWHKVYVILTFVSFFVVPLCILVYIYTVIIYKVLRNSMHGQGKDSSKVQANNPRTQLVSMLVGIIVLFFVCLLPFRIVALWMVFAPSEEINKLDLEHLINLMAFVRILIYVNSAGNPLIYHMFSQKFRKAFNKAVQCSRGETRRGSSHTATVTHYSFARSNEYECVTRINSSMPQLNMN
ncbi:QRFP-like peptide receptor [Gigantopelta aegis]|uniref:QRFP-like peptide receptor n=1 Tax=Gigantopelta aegis TaxID=1735272 RepID=UPI001B88D3CE|nr:QRFP-like peptide receptor [Gigantopelta aegis]